MTKLFGELLWYNESVETCDNTNDFSIILEVNQWIMQSWNDEMYKAFSICTTKAIYKTDVIFKCLIEKGILYLTNLEFSNNSFLLFINNSNNFLVFNCSSICLPCWDNLFFHVVVDLTWCDGDCMWWWLQHLLLMLLSCFCVWFYWGISSGFNICVLFEFESWSHCYCFGSKFLHL